MPAIIRWEQYDGIYEHRKDREIPEEEQKAREDKRAKDQEATRARYVLPHQRELYDL